MRTRERTTRYVWVALLLLLGAAPGARAEKIQTLCNIQGAEPLSVEGVGVVVGLNGTGDSTDAVRRLILQHLQANNIAIPSESLATKNMALVSVDAEIPPFARPGQRINVRVSSQSGAASIAGGVLKACVLRYRPDGKVVARALGRVIVGGPESTTTGYVQGGGEVIDPALVNRRIWDNNYTFRLVLHQHRFMDASMIANALNNTPRTNPYLNEPTFEFDEYNRPIKKIVARPLDAGLVQVTIPPRFRQEAVRYIANVLNIDVAVQRVASVLLDRQSGTAVISGDVKVLPGFISHRGRTIAIQNIQGRGEIYQEPPTNAVLDVRGPGRSVGAKETLQQLVDTLNAMQASTDEIIVILQKLKAAGLLQAELVVE